MSDLALLVQSKLLSMLVGLYDPIDQDRNILRCFAERLVVPALRVIFKQGKAGLSRRLCKKALLFCC
jgi:hypothetical protein